MSKKAILISLKSDGKLISSIEVAKGCEPILIGRSRGCALRVPGDDSSVSGKHARLFWKGSSLYLEDAGSRNGVFFNGKRLEKPVKVEIDGLYAIGNCLMIASAPDNRSGKTESKFHQLEFLNGDRIHQVVDIKARSDASDGAFMIGLDPSCDITLPDMLVSRKHAKIVMRANGECWIIDEGSRNGTFVNGEKLGVRERLLRDGDKISIAYFDLRFLDRNVRHTHANMWAKLGILLVTSAIIAVVWTIYSFSRPTAAHYREIAVKVAAKEKFDEAMAYIEQAKNARNASFEERDNSALAGRVKQWKETFALWESIRKSLGAGRLREARDGLDNISDEAYAWAWNDTSAKVARQDADFARSLLRKCTDMAEALRQIESKVVSQAFVTELITGIDDYTKANSQRFKVQPDLAPAVKVLNDFRARLVSIRDGIASIDKALNRVSPENPDFATAIAEFKRVADDESQMATVRNYARDLLPTSMFFLKTLKFLEDENTKLVDMDFAAVLKDAGALPLPDKDMCARQSKFSDMRAFFQKRHLTCQKEVENLAPMVHNLEAAGIRNGEIGHILTFTLNPATWEKALSFDCFKGRFPFPSRVDATGVYDELLGIESTYENLRELPKPPGRKTTVLMNFVPKCQTAKAAFDQVRTFLQFLDRPEGREYRTGKLGRLYALGAQILANREKIVALLKKRAKESSSQRAKIVAGYYAEYFSDEPSYADLRALEMAFHKLQKDINEMNERYSSEPDPEKRLKLRAEILDKGIPGMEAVRMRWVEVEAE